MTRRRITTTQRTTWATGQRFPGRQPRRVAATGGGWTRYLNGFLHSVDPFAIFRGATPSGRRRRRGRKAYRVGRR